MEDLSSKGIESSTVKEQLRTSSTLKIVVTPVNCISKSWTLKISLKRHKQADNWVTTFEASKEADFKSHSIDLDVVHSITEQNETQTIHIQELISDEDRSVDTQMIPALPDNKESFVDNLESAASYIESGEPQDDSQLSKEKKQIVPAFQEPQGSPPDNLLNLRPSAVSVETQTDPQEASNPSQGVTVVMPENLTFHPTEHSPRAVLSNDLRTVTTSRCWSSAITSRVLQSNERFCCILDGWNPRMPFHIGVRDVLINNLKYYHIRQMVVEKDSLSLREIGKPRRDYGSYPHPTQVGCRYSVVRRSNGDLHFEVNGMNLGVAFTNLPKKVYGYVLLNRGTQLTIR